MVSAQCSVLSVQSQSQFTVIARRFKDYKDQFYYLIADNT